MSCGLIKMLIRMLQQGSLNTYKKLIHNVGTMEGDLLHRQQIIDHTALTGKTGSNVITPLLKHKMFHPSKEMMGVSYKTRSRPKDIQHLSPLRARFKGCTDDHARPSPKVID